MSQKHKGPSSVLPPAPTQAVDPRVLVECLDRSPDAVLGVTPDLHIFYANHSACSLLGHEFGDLLGQDLQALQPGQPWGALKLPVLETFLEGPEGTRIPVEISQVRIARDGEDCRFFHIRDTTALKASEAALRRSESRYALAFNASPDAINLTRLDDGNYMEVSAGFERLMGWKRDEVIGRTSIELDIWADPEERRKMTTLLREKGEFDGALFHFRRKNGTILKGLMSGRMVSLEGVPCLLTVTRDITVQVEAQQAVGNLTDLIAGITANVPAFIALLDRNGHFLFLNRLAPGFRMEEVIGTDFRDGLDEEVRPAATRSLERILGGSAQETYEGWGWGPDRERRWYRTILGPMTEGSSVGGVILIALDETERRRQEERIRESEDRFQAFQLNTPDALFWIRIDLEGRMLLEGMNPAAERIMGTSSADAAGKPFDAFCPPTVAGMFTSHNLQTIEARRPLIFEETLPALDGTIRHLTTTLVPIQDDTGRVCRIVGSSRNTTEQHRMEAALRQTQKLESLGVLAGGIAHDFNNLLTAVMGNLNLAQLKLPETSPAIPHLEAVENIVLKASELTRQMLAYSGKGRFSVKPQCLNTLITEMVHLLKVTVTKKADLRVQLAPDLPAIEGDAAQIQQVIMNLVTNASDALGDTEGVIRLSTTVETLDRETLRAAFPAQALEPGLYAILEVEDTGCGISQEVLARIFDPFFTTKVQGRGLGLSAMMGILKGHRAGINIRTREGAGTLFQICFPATPKPAAPRPGVSQDSTAAFSGKVLLVDDETIILDSISMALESIGFTVIQAKDGVEAMERFQAEGTNLALVIMDLTMPRMDGATAFKSMRALHPGVPVILSSGYDRQALEGTQPEAFVQKPYRLKELKSLIRDVLGKEL